ncbi:centrosomal protein cep290-like [Nilaparvata lugens]|uniref:centrosomal protein cep290-like n=1 Tax=Nilaparvata lugens TaxID=108931 RepID=UPI00193C8733|nr:centrosomal protein cep290-like [Nilaparvata lugens]
MISLKGELGQKNDQLIEKEREVMELKRAHTNQQPSDDNQDESTEILALKTTVTSLQNIVNQKEETISRYQTLLKEAREEHSTAIQAMRQEMNSLEEELNKQTIAASSRLMIEKESSRPEQVKVLVEKYLCRIHELEDEMGQARDQIKQLTTQLHDCHKALSAQHDSIKPIPVSQRSDKRVEYVLKKVDEAEEESNDENSSDKDNKKDYSDDESEATESENAKDHDGKDLKRDYNILADQLRDQNELIEKLNNTIAELKNNKGESVSRERLRSELERKKRRIEMLESKVEEDKVEISRLRHQLTSRPTRPEGVGSLKEEQLLKRIKALEEDLNEVHQKAEKERESHRNKCAEEVERWQERKRWQSINDKLRNQVKTQSTQIETLKSSQQRFRDTITRLERERNTLESKLKSVKGSIPAQSLIEDLEREVKQLKARNEFLKKTSEITSTSSLSEVIECQQRKIEALQIAQKGDSALTEEIERLQERKGQLQKANIRLEGENLKLKLELEKRRTVQLDSDGSPESDGSDRVVSRDASTGSKKSKRSYEDLEKAVTVLRKVVEKLQNENKRLKTSETHQMRDDKGYMEKLQMELQKAQESYMDSLDKISSLEAHLKMEKENYRMVQEQLLQKARLLTKCKILLERAAVREKALNEQVSDLQKLIPPESLQGTYHSTLH